MASEDSDELVTGLLVIHRLGDASDLDKTVPRQVPTRLDHIHARRKPLEVVSLRGTKRVSSEERNDRLHEMFTPGHGVLAQVLPVVVVPSVDMKSSYAEELLELFEA